MSGSSAARQAALRAARPWRLSGPFGSPLALAGIALVLTSAFFVLFPDVDRWTSALFLGPEGGFPLARSGISKAIRLAFDVVTIAVLAVSLGALLVHLMWRRPWVVLVTPSQALFLLLSYAIVPGLLVNGILKEYSGRARPRALLEFNSGGELFTPAWVHADQCWYNCSFPSGEASAAMALVAVVMVLPFAWRRRAHMLVIPVILVISANRIVMGGHFLSDVVIGWCLTLVAIYWLRSLMLGETAAARIDDTLSGAVPRLAARFRSSLTRLDKQDADGEQREDAGEKPVDGAGDERARLEPVGELMGAEDDRGHQRDRQNGEQAA